MELSSTFVVLGPDLAAVPVAVTPTVYEQLDRDFDGFKGRVLVARYAFDSDWPTWEIHPHGDEIVVLMAGRAEMILDESAGRRCVVLEKPGEFVIVPKATWHTARIAEPTSMLFVTPGEGTENRAP